MRLSRSALAVVVLGCIIATAVAGATVRASAATTRPRPKVRIRHAAHRDVSPPLRALRPLRPSTRRVEMDEHELPRHVPPGLPDPVVQRQATASPAAPTAGAGFEGLGTGLARAVVNSAPPDPNGDVGPNNYVQIVNQQFAVFTKTGSVVYGPVDTSTLWEGFGGGCETNNDGDATVKYDRRANRWVISQFSVSTRPYLECVAVSTTPDPTGSYYRYSFNYGNTAFPDYPKLGIWPDAYYETYNIFNGGRTFAGAEVCAFNRSAMLAGGAAAQQCFSTTAAYGGLLPADLDGSTPPPAGSPNYVLNFGTGALNLWKFHADWTNPSASTFMGPTSIPVATFSAACNGGGACIPQAGTFYQLDSLADRLMYRLAYRNFGDHESLVVNDSVTAGSSVGIRWYELRNLSTTPTVYQQSTYAPDATYRWMGSIAMDHAGDIGLEYSASSSSMNPAIRYTGRLAADPLNTLEAESTLIQGTGSQTGNLDRWGDYSSLSVDPSNDCTFWFTNEYLAAYGSFNWRTRIGSFSFPSCSQPPPVPGNDFSLSASSTSLTMNQGASSTSTISTSVTSGSAESVSLSASGQPAGATVGFSPSTVTAGGSSTMTVAAGTAAPGAYTIIVTATSTSATHTIPVTLTVLGNDFGITAGPTSLTVDQGQSATSTVATSVASGSAETVALSASGQPAGTTVSFSPSSVTASGSSTMTVSNATSTGGTYTITVTGTAPSATHATTVTLTVPSHNVVQNPGFETGSLTPWLTSGLVAPIIVGSGAHAGTYAARPGSPTPYNGNSTFQQTVAVPAGGGTLSYWYNPHCPDTLTYDQQQVQVRNTSGIVLATVMNICSNTGVWTQKTFSMAAYAGQTVVLWFNVHDDGWPTDPSYMLVDDVAVQ
jgi:hypothetical protein